MAVVQWHRPQYHQLVSLLLRMVPHLVLGQRRDVNFNSTRPNQFNLTVPGSLVPTVVDDLFGFDELAPHPIFPNLPQPFNTVFNHSTVYGHESVYLLAASATETYTLCSIRALQSPNCSTEYNASMSGGFLTSHCEPNNPISYIRSQPKAPIVIRDKNWADVATDWGLSLSLNDGITNGQSSNARLLSQLIPTSGALNPSLPSISEALAVLAGSTLVLSSQGAPFIHYWNYSSTVFTLTDPQYQAFNATLRTQEYQSGGNKRWHGIFYVVLAVVFINNVFLLVLLSISGTHITDLNEPQKKFTLYLNSPPSAVLDGSCGGSLEKEQLSASWRIMHDKERQHLYFDSKGVRKEARKRSFSRQTNFEMEGPIESAFRELGRKRMSRL